MAGFGVAQSALSPDATNLQRLPVAFSKKFLEALEKMGITPFHKYVSEYPIQQKSGYKVVVTLTPSLTVSTTSARLGQTQSARDTGFSTTNIVMTLAMYGNDIGWGALFDLTAVDLVDETHSRALARNARETAAQLVVDNLNAHTVDATLTTGLSMSRLIAASRTLKVQKTHGFEELNDHYCCVVGPYGWEDISAEGNPTYASHYQTIPGSEVFASGKLNKAAADLMFFTSNACLTGASFERQYIWGEGAIARTQLKYGVAGSDGKAIDMPGVASLVGYLIPARAEGRDPYGLESHAVWRMGPIDTAIADNNRVYTIDARIDV